MIGRTISHFQIIEKLGSGAMGVVYKAHDVKLDRVVALKFLSPFLNVDAEAKQRFITEAKTASSLDHPNICTIHEISETEDGQIFIAMACYEGETLQNRIAAASNGIHSINEIMDITLQIARGLGKAHARGIIHRDIKPANIIITSDGVAKILDFGLAKLTTQSRITKTGSTLGTVAYMSPEQTGGEQVDQCSDLWSLGVVLYEMLTGHLPFRGGHEAVLIYRINNEKPTPVQQYCQDIPQALITVINRTLEKDPAKRYQNVNEFIHDIEICQTPGAILTASAKPTTKKLTALKKRTLIIATTAIMLLLVLSLTLYWLNQKRHMDSLLSDKVIAIFPFTVRGSTDLNLLQEGMIDLLFINLNHAGELRSVDPHALLNQVKLLSKSDLNLQDAKKIAQFFGAGFYIIGSIFIAQGRLRCNATLYKTRGNETTAQFIVAEAPVDRSLDLVDDITKQIIAKYSKAPADRKQLLGAMTTQSWPALKAYLEGLQADRGGRFREAYDLYNSAVKQDSSFALAWLLLSELNRGFLFRHEEAQAALYQASLHSDKLSLHERRLLTIQQALLDGEHDKVLKGCRQIVDENPDDIFGWDGLATYWQQVASLLGYSILECKPAFARLLSLDPENATNYQQRLVIANRQGKIDEIDSLIAKLKQLSPNHEWAWPMVIPRAYMTDNPVARQKVLQEAENQSNIILKNGPVMCAVWGKDLRNVIPLTRKLLDRSRPQETQATGYLMLAVLELSQGKWRTAREKLDSLNSYDPNYMHAFCGLFSPVYYYHAQKPDLRQVYKDVIDWQASTKTQQGDTENDFMPLVSLLPQIRWYYLGLLTAFNGDSSQTAVFCRNLLSKKTPHEAKSLIRIWVATLQALIARGNHYDNAALELLAKEPVIMRFPFYWGPVYSTAFSRYLRAELLYRLGRNEEALNWYRSLAEIYFYDLPYRAPAAFKIAEICENAGRREEAIHEYERFLALWRDCDPEFKPMTAVAEKRLVELKKWGE